MKVMYPLINNREEQLKNNAFDVRLRETITSTFNLLPLSFKIDRKHYYNYGINAIFKFFILKNRIKNSFMRG